MIAQSIYEEQFTSNNDNTCAQNLLTEMKSVQRVAEAVDSIIIPEDDNKRDHKKIQVVILNKWDVVQSEISIPEIYPGNNSSITGDWDEVADKNCYELREDDTCKLSNTEEDEVDDEDQEAAKNLSWLLNFKVESLFGPLDKNECVKDSSASKEDRIHRKNCKCGCGNNLRDQKAGDTAQSVWTPEPQNSIKYKKPPFTYTELIEQALRERGELTVSGIYKWISHNFPYYRVDDDRWKNSVRHNLSINPHFSKGGKAQKGAGHLWTVVTGEDRSRSSWKRRRLEQFVNEQRRREAAHQDDSAYQEAQDAATFIAEYAIDDDVAAEEECHETIDQQGWVTTHIISLEQSAEDILMGVKREVEVEYLSSIPPDEETERSCGSADSDFLNPISKHEAVKESGLLSDEALASYNDLQLSHPSNDVSFFSDEEMTLQYYELALAASNP